MAETIGLLILSEVGATASVTGFGSAALTIEVGTASISAATVVGTAAIIGASIGLQYALSNPNLPTPEHGSQALKQAIPPRIRGYGVNRLAGYYMLFEAGGAPPANSYDMLAFHSGPVDSVIAFYLSDDLILADADVSHGGGGQLVPTFTDGRYVSCITVDVALGHDAQTASTLFTTDPKISDRWTTAHKGDGIAWVAMTCAGISDTKIFTQRYPRGHPELSVVAVCSPVWDPRDPSQHHADPASWKVSYNPVLQLIDYLTRADGGMGLDLDVILPPARLAEWMVEANLCDQVVATADGGLEARYFSHGWFRFDTSPEEIVNGILASCDGWLAESGDGTLSLTVGYYRAPTDPALTEKHILGDLELNYGTADEQIINVLNVRFTDPSARYVLNDLGDWRDEVSISLTGVERAKPLSLQWVQSSSQASRLADRAMKRVNPILSGSFTTTLYGLRYLGKRWVPIQYPFVSGLQNSVVEIQGAEVDLLGGQIKWDFILIDADTIEAYDPDADELSPPVIPPTDGSALLLREDSTPLLREAGGAYLRES